MENKVIVKEYVDKNYVEKSILKKAMREGMMQAKVFEEKAGADIMAKYILVAMGELDKKALDLYEANNRINDLLDIVVKQKDEAIKILLTAFEKEKEKNKELEHQQQVEIEGRNILVGLNENLKEELKKEKEKNKILELTKIPCLEDEIMAYKENDAVQRKMLNDAFDRGWIHKDKIKELQNNYVGQYLKFFEKIQQLLEEE